MDAVLTAENKINFQHLLDLFEGESRKKVLELYSKRTEAMIVSQNKECSHLNIFMNGNKLKQRNQFKYLGFLISSDRYNITEVVSRTAQAKKKFKELNQN